MLVDVIIVKGVWGGVSGSVDEVWMQWGASGCGFK